ncbi:MAG: hypothetical protein GY757_31260, partial [bacterium]|nr:hypothetical protein [bacterium]
LPDYMIPSYFVVVEHIPLTPNGKLDHRALPQPEITVKSDYTGPGNAVEEKLVDIWSEILHIEKDTIGIDTNFFQLGGHSLKATVMIAKIENEFEVNVPLTMVFQTPTVRNVSRYIIDTGGKQNYMKLNENLNLLRRSDNTAKNLFLIHDGSGDVDGYVEICKRMTAEFNCWGIRAERLENYAPGELDCREIAKDYILKIKKQQPRGPYYLAGWSIGGTIAFEMAKQLKDEKDEIAFIGLIDTKPPSGSSKLKTDKFSLETESELITHLFAEFKIEKEIEEIKALKEFWPAILDYVKNSGFNRGNIKERVLEYLGMGDVTWGQRWTLQEALYHLNMFRTMEKLFRDYNPEGKIDAPLYYFGADSSELKSENWQKYVSVPVIYFEVKGGHFSILRDPQVIELAKVFSEAMY